MKDYEIQYQAFWKEIVEKDGKVDMEQVKRELYDFSNMIKDLPILFEEITNGRISAPDTKVIEVIEIFREIYAPCNKLLIRIEQKKKLNEFRVRAELELADDDFKWIYDEYGIGVTNRYLLQEKGEYVEIEQSLRLWGIIFNRKNELSRLD